MPPRQAAILCGGLGSRMRPLTDKMPKPMAPVNGRPFLSYLIAQLREQGVERVVLLTGYLGEQIRRHFGDGTTSGVAIEYSQGPVEWDTGRRVWEARALLEERFLLLYSDNFTMFSLPNLLDLHRRSRTAISLLVQPKVPGNVSVDDGGLVMEYDATRGVKGLDCVEIGYMLVERDALFSTYERPDISFSSILRKMADDRRLAALKCRDVYHSISDPARWKLAERYLAVKRIVLIDRDGTINERPARGEYVRSWQEFKWLDDTVGSMQRLAARGFRFIVVSNQAGIARGMVGAEEVAAINRRMVQELGKQGIEILDVYVCPHHWDAGCECRKPEPGMLLRASREHLLRMDRTVFIGDDPRDREAAENAGCASIIIGPEHDVTGGPPANPATGSLTLSEALPWILDLFEDWESRC